MQGGSPGQNGPDIVRSYTNNRINGFSYDAAGNLTNDLGQTFTYDATGQQATATYTGYSLTQNYDGDGLRVKKNDNGTVTYYLRSTVLGGQVMAEMSSNGARTREYLYLGGQLLALRTPFGRGVKNYWVHEDPITKSKRITDNLGTVVSTIEMDPWGADTNRSNNAAFQPKKFTSYERDANGSDEAMFRRSNRWHSRFDQPDPYDGSYSPTNPQSFNRYAYVQNDPVNFVDPSGLEFCMPFIGCIGITVITTNTVAPHWPWGGGGGGGGSRHDLLLDTGNEGGGGGGGGPDPQATGQNPVEGEKRWNDCMGKYLSEDYPEGKPKPTGIAVGLALYGGLNDVGDSAMILALWAKESSFDLRPRDDHGPLQLTSWWSNYSNRNNLNLIVPGAYDTFGRPAGSANRNRQFEGNIEANVMTGGNIIRHSQNALGQSYRQIGYGYGPGPDKATRNAYADHAAKLQQRYANFLNCLRTGQ